jgi:GNAT superfamily N-acetyltransferase
MIREFLLYFCLFLLSDSFSASKETLEEGSNKESPLSARLISAVSQEYYSPDKIVKIRCWKSEPLNVDGERSKIKYSIFLAGQEGEGDEIGNVELSYYGNGGLYKTVDHQSMGDPLVHLKFITIHEHSREKGHARRALDALFQGLKQARPLTLETVIGLEYDRDKPFLGRFYGRYGFQRASHLYSTGYCSANQGLYHVMLARLGDIKLSEVLE